MNNMTDYTQVGQMSVSQQETVLRKTYGLLALSFLPCAAGAYVSMMFNPLAMLGGRWVSIAVFFAFFYGMCWLIEKNRYSNTGAALLMGFTFGMGVMLGPILQYSAKFSNGAQLVVLAALMTAGVFFTMAALARRASFNTNSLGRFLAVGGVILMIGVVANLFFQAPVFSLVLSAAFALFSSLLIMWQVRNVLEGGEDSHISAALTIFISIYNVFSSLLRLLLSFAGEE